MPPSPIVALEIGTTKVVALVGELRNDGRLVITGMGEHESKGVRKGEIIDIETAAYGVRSALHGAEESSQVTIREVVLVISGSHFQSQVQRGTVRVTGRDGTVTADDIEQVREHARAVNLPPDRDRVHSIRQTFYLDGEHAVANPEGMVASQLSLDMLILHGLSSRIDNAIRVVNGIPMEVDDTVFGGLCSAIAVVPPEHKEIGALVIDLGGGTTDYVLYADKKLAAAGSLAVGGDHVTNDIAQAFGIPIKQAESLKKEQGSAVFDHSVRSKRVELPPDVGFRESSVSIAGLHTVINARVEETLSLVKKSLGAPGLLSRIGAGVILTGGGARMKGIEKVASDVFNLPCRVGVARDIDGFAAVTEGPEYAAAVGGVRYGFEQGAHQGGTGVVSKLLDKIFRRQ